MSKVLKLLRTGIAVLLAFVAVVTSWGGLLTVSIVPLVMIVKAFGVAMPWTWDGLILLAGAGGTSWIFGVLVAKSLKGDLSM